MAVYEFKLPDIGEGVVEGEIVRWLIKEGDVLRADQPMVEVMTDKATVEIPSPRAGRVLERLYQEGQICPVGKVLVRIEEAAGAGKPGDEPKKPEKPPKPEPATRPASKPERPSPEKAPGLAPDASRGNAAPDRGGWDVGRALVDGGAASRVEASAVAAAASVLATPATRKLARELGVELARIAGTGPAGRITSEDVRRAGQGGNGGAAGESRAPTFAPPPGVQAADVRVPFRGLRRRIAEHMVRSRREAAHFTYVEEVDCSQLVDLREKANARRAGANGNDGGLKLSFLPFIVRATVEALRKFPAMNAYLDEAAGEIVQRRQYHIGLATATDDGLVVPVVRDADRKSIVELARDIDRLARLTRSGKATREDLSGSTFTITSLGALGGVLATPILNYPEAGILGVHKIAKRPAVAGDKIVIKDLMNLSISVDHRLVDGHEAARFVAHIKESLEAPGLLFLESI
jgi:pyruvate dehydrogenase E2 component (dihydrolipoamide acetyltransferase)